MKKIVWLASYPKSGNTWVRTFLTYLIKRDGVDESAINNLIAPIFSSRQWLDEYMFLESSELTRTQIEIYTPLAISEAAKYIEVMPFFFKAHDAYIHTGKQEPIYPADVSIGSVYIVRNPLDVVASYAHHNNDTIDNTIKKMADEKYALFNNTATVKGQVRQRLLSWSGHVDSWLAQQEIPLLLIRYEDMVLDTLNTFKKIVTFSNLSFTDDEIKESIEKSAFEKLQQQENKHGFQEKATSTKSFFRKGKIGSWRESLTDAQAQQVIDTHREVMHRLGYLDARGNPIY